MILRPAPKPQKPTKNPEYLAEVAKQPCVCWGDECTYWPVVVHHCIMGRFSQSRASDEDTIPLCPYHHWELHNERARWKAQFGEDWKYIALVKATMDMP